MVIRTLRLIPVAATLFASMFCQARPSQKAVTIVAATCDGKLSSIVVSALKDAVTASKKYHLTSALDDKDRRDVVQVILLSCIESKDFSVIAMLFGSSECRSAKHCFPTMDSESLNTALCYDNFSVDCGRAIFEDFDTYIDGPVRKHTNSGSDCGFRCCAFIWRSLLIPKETAEGVRKGNQTEPIMVRTTNHLTLLHLEIPLVRLT